MNTQPTLENLQDIKKGLEDKMSESSDSTYNTSDDESSSQNSKSSKKNYKSKYRNLESKLRYMQLEMVNKDIEITEFKDKFNNFNKFQELIKKITFLFDRLDNAYKVLTERVNTINDDNYIKMDSLTILDTIKLSSIRVQDKYKLYLNNDVLPLFDENQIYFKNAILLLYDNKSKDISAITKKINDKVIYINHQNSKWILLFILFIVLIIQVCVFLLYYLYNYLK